MIILFIIIITILIFFFISRSKVIENFNEHQNNIIIYDGKKKDEISIELVIAHYKEDISWVELLPEKFKIYVYSKGTEKPNIKRKYIHKFLSNIGRCDHTYLYHIIENFNNLSDQVIFCTGSTYALSHKWYVFQKIKENIGKYHFYTTKLFRAHSKYSNFRILKYCASHKVNLTDSSCDIIRSKYKNLGDYENQMIGKGQIRYITFYGVFSVSKENIKSYPLHIYKKLIEPLKEGDNLEDGHFMERLWAHMYFDK